jgi:hypothetical protein
MKSVVWIAALGTGLSLVMAACSGGGGGSTPPTTYTVTVNSTNPVSGVAISVSPADVNSASNGTTSFTRTYDSGATVTLTAPATSGSNTFSSWSGCTSSSTVTCTVTVSANTTVTANYTVAPATYTLTVNSTNPDGGVPIRVSPADNNSITSGETPYTLTYNAGTSVTLTAPATSGGNFFSSWTGCTSASTVTCTVSLGANTTVTANYVTPYTLTMTSTNPASGVAITVSPADLNSASNGSTSFTRTYGAGTTVTLTAPATSGNDTFSSWTGCTSASAGTCTVTLSANTTVTANYLTPYTLTVLSSNPGSDVAITASPADLNGNSSGNTSFTLTYRPGASVILTAPATAGNNISPSWSGCTSATVASCTVAMYGNVTVSVHYIAPAPNTVTANPANTGIAVTDQLLGMNMAAWYDVATNQTAIVDAFQAAGIKAVRWPGGSWSDVYHWATNTNCQNGAHGGGTPNSNDIFADFVNDIATPAGLDVALTADYGTNPACNGGGEPSEAAAWVTAALTDGITVSHMTVGNEVYGSTWEEDLHATPNDPTTYAAAVVGSSGYYQSIKAAGSKTLVGVVVNPGNSPAWDPTVLANAAGYYDFVEYHYYPEAPDQTNGETYENDTFLVQQAAQGLTTNINTIKSELSTAGEANTPIYVGEIGGVYTDPGKQSWSITQGLYAGQALGELMNDGVSRLTWWIGFGNCNGQTDFDFSSVYGWQTFGAYNVFSDGPTEDPTCPDAGPIGTMSPTARAFQLMSNVLVTGEHVLTPTVTGDTTDVRAYAATHSGGTALVVFNDNETTTESVNIALTGVSSATDVQVITYDKAIYDESNPATTDTWAAPTTVDMGAQSVPFILTLSPWSMNVVIVQ